MAKQLKLGKEGVLESGARIKISPLFGVVIGEKGEAILESTQDDAIAENISRELGIQRDLYRNNRLAEGLSKPEEYLATKNAALRQMTKDLTPSYKAEYVRLVNLGYSSEEADKKALSYVKSVSNIKMKEINQEFPTEITKKVIGKLVSGNNKGKEEK